MADEEWTSPRQRSGQPSGRSRVNQLRERFEQQDADGRTGNRGAADSEPYQGESPPSQGQPHIQQESSAGNSGKGYLESELISLLEHYSPELIEPEGEYSPEFLINFLYNLLQDFDQKAQQMEYFKEMVEEAQGDQGSQGLFSAKGQGQSEEFIPSTLHDDYDESQPAKPRYRRYAPSPLSDSSYNRQQDHEQEYYADQECPDYSYDAEDEHFGNDTESSIEQMRDDRDFNDSFTMDDLLSLRSGGSSVDSVFLPGTYPWKHSQTVQFAQALKKRHVEPSDPDDTGFAPTPPGKHERDIEEALQGFDDMFEGFDDSTGGEDDSFGQEEPEDEQIIAEEQEDGEQDMKREDELEEHGKMDYAVNKTIHLQSPSKQDPIELNIKIEPQSINQSDSGQNVVCKINLNVQQMGPPRSAWFNPPRTQRRVFWRGGVPPPVTLSRVHKGKYADDTSPKSIFRHKVHGAKNLFGQRRKFHVNRNLPKQTVEWETPERKRPPVTSSPKRHGKFEGDTPRGVFKKGHEKNVANLFKQPKAETHDSSSLQANPNSTIEWYRYKPEPQSEGRPSITSSTERPGEYEGETPKGIFIRGRQYKERNLYNQPKATHESEEDHSKYKPRSPDVEWEERKSPSITSSTERSGEFEGETPRGIFHHGHMYYRNLFDQPKANQEPQESEDANLTMEWSKEDQPEESDAEEEEEYNSEYERWLNSSY